MSDELGRTVGEGTKHKGLTVTSLAQELDISRNYLYQILAGRQRPSIKVCKQLSKALSLDLQKVIIMAGFASPEQFMLNCYSA